MNATNIASILPVEWKSFIFDGKYEEYPFKKYFLIVFSITGIILVLCLNILLLIFLRKSNELCECIYLLFANLSCCDILISISVSSVPISILKKFSQNVCLPFAIFQAISVMESIFTFNVLAIHFFIFLKYPLKFSLIITRRSIKYFIIISWIFCFSFGLIMGLGFKKDIKEPILCIGVVGHIPHIAYQITTMMLIISMYVINGIIYIYVIIIVQKHKRAIGENTQSDLKQNNNKKNTIELFKILLKIFGTSILLPLPYFLWSAVRDEESRLELWEYFFLDISALLILLNSILNPLFFFSRHGGLKIVLKKIFF